MLWRACPRFEGKVDAPKEASTDGEYQTHGLKKDIELMERLDLSKLKPELPLKKRWRPKKMSEELDVKMPYRYLKKILQDKSLVP